MYHYAGNNPIKYSDPDGNSDKVIISPGHGMDKKGQDRGAVIDGVAEVKVIYDFCKKLYSALSNNNITYVNLKQIIEDTTKDHSTQGRVDASNVVDAEIDASLQLCVHADANTKGYEGVTIYYIAGKERSQKIASYFSERLNKAGIECRIKPDTDTGVGSLGELRRTTAPSILIEIGSLDTKESRAKMYSRMDLLSRTLADSVKTFNKDRPNWE